MRGALWYTARMGTQRKVFVVLLVAGALGLSSLLAWQHARQQAPTPAGAQAPAQQLMGGLILLRPEQLVGAPVVDGFQWPCGAPNGAMMYDAQPFGAVNAKRGGHHTGQDLNGIGGENTDEGLPVCAAARGLVVYSGEPSPEWGNVVVLAHRLPGAEGRVVQTLYAHLNTREARVGERMSRGERLGTVGTAHGAYLAHLHFEAIPSTCTEAGMPGYHPVGTMNRMNPAELISRYPAPGFPDPFESVRHLRRRQAPSQPATQPQQQSGGGSEQHFLSV